MAGKVAGKKSNAKTRKSGGGVKKKADPVSGSVRAGTLFPVGRLNRYLKQGRYSERVGASAGAFLAAVLEYITAEILELAGDLSKDAKMKTIKPSHINLGIRSDEELCKMISNTVVSEGGQLSNINTDLFPEKKKKKADNE